MQIVYDLTTSTIDMTPQASRKICRSFVARSYTTRLIPDQKWRVIYRWPTIDQQAATNERNHQFLSG